MSDGINNSSHPFRDLDQADGYWRNTALKFSRDEKTGDLACKKSVMMTLSSGVNRFFNWLLPDPESGGAKTDAEIAENQASIKALLDYIKQQGGERVHDYVKKGTARLNGDVKGSNYTIKDRLDRGSFVSSKLVKRMKDLAIEGWQQQQNAPASQQKSPNSRSSSRSQSLTDASTSETNPNLGPDDDHSNTTAQVATSATDPTNRPTHKRRTNLDFVTDVTSQVIGNTTSSTEKPKGPPHRSESLDSNASNITTIVIDDQPPGDQAHVSDKEISTTPVFIDEFDHTAELPKLHDRIISNVLNGLHSVDESTAMYLRPMLEKQCLVLDGNQDLQFKSGLVRNPEKFQQRCKVLQEQLEDTVNEMVSDTVSSAGKLRTVDKTTLQKCRGEALEAARTAFQCLVQDIVDNGAFDESKSGQSSYKGFPSYVDAFVDLADKSQRYTAARICAQQPKRETKPTEKEYQEDLDALLNQARSGFDAKELPDNWSNTYFDELAFGLGFLEAQDRAIQQKNATVADFGDRQFQFGVGDLDDLMNGIDEDVQAQKNLNIESPEINDPETTKSHNSNQSQSSSDAQLDEVSDDREADLPYMAVRRCMSRAAVALSTDKASAEESLAGAFVFSEGFDYEQDQVLVDQNDGQQANDSEKAQRMVQPAILNAYHSTIPKLRLTMYGIDQSFA